MPRIRRGLEEPPKRVNPELVRQLVAELRKDRESGQPLIDEQHFPESGAIRVVVIWDQWGHLPDGERTETILQAYEEVEGSDFRNRIAIAAGFTTPEAIDSGLLPYQVIPLVRSDDAVTLEQCQKAMLDEGASQALGVDRPVLRFMTLDEAEACRRRLIQRLPGSEPVWTISQET